MFGRAKTWQINIAVFFIISCGVLLGLAFGQVNGAAAIFFPAAGISAALYYIFRKKIVIGLFSGIFLTNLIYRMVAIDEPFFQSLTMVFVFLLSNVIGVILFCLILRKLNYKVENAFTFYDSGKFMAGVVASSSASALIGVLGLIMHYSDIDIVRTFFYWMIGDATGIIVFASLILYHNYHDEPIFTKKNNTLLGILYIAVFAMFIFFIFGEYGNDFMDFGNFQVFLVLMYIFSAFVFSFRMIAVINVIFLLGLNFLYFPTYSGGEFFLEAVNLSLFLIIMSSTTSSIRVLILQRQSNLDQMRIAKDSLEKIIISTNNLVNIENKMPQEENIFGNAYLKNMFEIACEIYPEFDRASCNIVKGDYVEFIGAVGYDVEVLNSLKLSAEHFMWNLDEPEIFSESKYKKKFTDTEENIKFTSSYGLPKESIRFTVSIGEDSFAGMSFDLFNESQHIFTDKDLDNYKSFQKLMNSYYKIGVLSSEKDILKDDIVLSLVRTLELYDLYTSGHSEQVAHLCAEFGKYLDLSSDEIRELYWAGIVHDIGKIGLPADVLNMKRKLTDDEFEQVKKHPENGHNILSRSQSLRNIADVVLHHHEWWNGKGYPHGLIGDAIPYHSRILHICDAVDAMAKDRVYRKALTEEQIIQQLDDGINKQFHPDIAGNMIKFIKAGKLREIL